jgi:hypothetical protein
MSEIFKWCEIGKKQTHRYEVLQKFLVQNNIPNEFQFIEADESNLSDKIQEAQKSNFFIRFEPGLWEMVSAHVVQNKIDLGTLKAIDALLLGVEKTYWPEIIFKAALIEYLTSTIKNLDVSQKALVIGADGLARATISSLVKMGFSNINITNDDLEVTKKLVDDFKEMYFHVKFEVTNRKDVTILPGVHGLVVSTYSVLENSEFLGEICYFNFLKKGGLVIDMVDFPLESPFLRIAEDIGAKVIHGFDIFSYYDLVWVQKVSGKVLDFNSYATLVKDHLQGVPYDKSKLQKIFDEFQL